MYSDAVSAPMTGKGACFPVLGTSPGPRYAHTLTAITPVDGDISKTILVMFGGAASSPQASATTPGDTIISDGVCEVHILDVSSGTWSQALPVGEPPTPRASHAATAVGRMIFIQGGIGADGLCSEELHALDLTEQNRPKWLRLSVQGTGPGPRYGHIMTLVAHRFVVVFGGHDGCTTLADTWVLDTAQTAYQWHKVADNGMGSPSARMYAAAAFGSDGTLLLCGGQNAQGVPLADVYTLAAQQDGQWEWRANECSMPAARSQHTAAVVDSEIHVFGGRSEANELELQHFAAVYRPTLQLWTNTQPFGSSEAGTCGRYQHATAAVGSSIFLHGGVQDGTVLDDMLLLCGGDACDAGLGDPTSPAWQQWLRGVQQCEAAAECGSPAVEEDGQTEMKDNRSVITAAARFLSKQQPDPGLDEEQLLHRITAYRHHITQVSAVLEEKKQEVQQAPVLVPQSAAEPPGAVDEFAALGKEGVDFSYGNIEDVDEVEWQVPPYCVPIHANVTTFDWRALYEYTQFDVIMMDPPWQLATANPTRGVSLGYSQLTDYEIEALPIPKLQQNGYLFIWLINNKYKLTLDLFEKWGYSLVDEIVWVKMTVNRRLAKSHGYYLQHAKEVCLVGRRGDTSKFETGKLVGSDIIFSERRGQSQKPEEVYELIEQLVPNGRYLEIFARKNNLRNYWVSIGNEVTGTGLPEESLAELK